MENPEKKKETHSFCGSPRYPNSKKTHCPGQVAGQPLWKDPSVPSPGTQVAGKFMEDFSDGKPETKMFIMSDWDYYSQNMEKLNMFQTINQMMFIDFPIQFVIVGAYIIVYHIFCFCTRPMPNFYTASNLLSGKKST
jgi:hypothetical protein